MLQSPDGDADCFSATGNATLFRCYGARGPRGGITARTGCNRMNSEAITPLSIAGTAEDTPAFVQGLGDAFERYGFAVIADHGVSAELIASVFKATRDFFALPTNTKTRFHVQAAAASVATRRSASKLPRVRHAPT